MSEKLKEAAHDHEQERIRGLRETLTGMDFDPDALPSLYEIMQRLDEIMEGKNEQ